MSKKVTWQMPGIFVLNRVLTVTNGIGRKSLIETTKKL